MSAKKSRFPIRILFFAPVTGLAFLVFQDWLNFLDAPDVDQVLFRASCALGCIGFTTLCFFGREESGPLVFGMVALLLAGCVSFPVTFL